MNYSSDLFFPFIGSFKKWHHTIWHHTIMFAQRLFVALACIISGLITILLTYYKPPAYWNNVSRKFFRPLIGDRATALLHYLIGAGLIAMGIILLSSK